MTISSETNRSGPYNGNDVTVVFAGGFKISDDAHVQVILTDADDLETVQVLTTDYSVSGVGDNTFDVTMVVAPASGETLTLIRNVPFTQETDLQNQGAYFAETIEAALDLGVARDQQLLEELDRAVKVPASSTVDPDDLIASLIATAAAVAAVYDAFDDLYLGAKASDPTLDNDGDALITGALYFDTVAMGMKVWSGSAWLVTYAPGGAYAALANNLSDLASASAARTNLGLGNVDNTSDADKPVSTAQQTALDLKVGTSAYATAAEYRNNTSTKILTTDQVWAAAATVALTDAATIAVDMATFFNGTVTLGGNRTLGQPSNTKVGQSGFIKITQDGTGSRTLAFHADWKFEFGVDAVLSTAAGAIDILHYEVIAANFIEASLSKGLA